MKSRDIKQAKDANNYPADAQKKVIENQKNKR